jgi:predicted nucleotidyltransferase
VPLPLEQARWIAQQLGAQPAVVAVALAGSRAAGANDPASDFDLYVYAAAEVPVAFRRTLAAPDAEIDNRFWEPGDEWIDLAAGAHFDVMFRSPAWIEDQLDRVLVRHEASIGYSTCFWYNVLHSEALYDPQGWYHRLQERARVPYPEELQRAIVAKNWPILRKNQSSYRRQTELALQRGDAVSVQHRTTALLASYFDIWFALAREPHPGEKRLLQRLTEAEAALVRAVIDSPPDQLLSRLDALLDALDARLHLIKKFPQPV